MTDSSNQHNDKGKRPSKNEYWEAFQQQQFFKKAIHDYLRRGIKTKRS